MTAERPVAIIDIGSNSVRLVVYSGATRVPALTFNEKVLAGLGRLTDANELAPGPQEKALSAIARFHLLLAHMNVVRTRVVATAAVRDARNGGDFVKAIKRIGFDCEILSADEEARLAGTGVLSAIPEARGIVGDLGGGSLELVQVGDGRVGTGVSMPLGVLRVPSGPEAEKQVRKTIRQTLDRAGLRGRGKGEAFYMVGGSWRALAKMDMLATAFPLPITQQYCMHPDRVADLRRLASAPDRTLTKGIAPARLASTPAAAMLLSALVDEIEPSELVVSSFGIREGLLYSSLSARVRRCDPLIEGAREASGGERRFGEHGDLLDDWISPLFDDPPHLERLRHAGCILADVAWQANPDFRADRGVEMALHGNWVSVTAAERVIMAQALSSNFGRDKLLGPELASLCTTEDLHRARRWGLAMRLAQRLSGGVASVLHETELHCDGERLELHVPAKENALVGDQVLRRLNAVAESLDLQSDVVADL
ncbi:MAG: Ppx/GppA family phosphatase [Sphingomicrobium sp.]